ncbi:hypothetical protein NSQ26_09730 [Bacillus sp. FSL W7-1360]
MKEIFEGLEEARQKFNKHRGHTWIMADLDEGTAWTVIGDCPDYDSDTVVCLVAKGGHIDREDRRYGADSLKRIVLKSMEYRI